MQSLLNFETMDTHVTMNWLKFLQRPYEPALLQRVAADMSRPKKNIKEIQDRASTYQKQQWINWHWGAVKPVRTPVAILGSLGVCIYVPASRHGLISYPPIHLT